MPPLSRRCLARCLARSQTTPLSWNRVGTQAFPRRHRPRCCGMCTRGARYEFAITSTLPLGQDPNLNLDAADGVARTGPPRARALECPPCRRAGGFGMARSGCSA
eukprot:352307-Chlamydomonas_euryale.AAC.3